MRHTLPTPPPTTPFHPPLSGLTDVCAAQKNLYTSKEPWAVDFGTFTHCHGHEVNGIGAGVANARVLENAFISDERYHVTSGLAYDIHANSQNSVFHCSPPSYWWWCVFRTLQHASQSPQHLHSLTLTRHRAVSLRSLVPASQPSPSPLPIDTTLNRSPILPPHSSYFEWRWNLPQIQQISTCLEVFMGNRFFQSKCHTCGRC